jgi:hypothetical protein
MVVFRVFRVCCLLLFSLSAYSVNADTVTYTFESPVFFPNEIVPLLNRAPNSGSDAFRASFTSTGMPTGPFRIASVPHPAFTGQSLFNPTNPSSLTISFNMPVNQVQFTLGLAVAGVLTLTSPVGTISQNSALLGPNFHGGTLVFSSSIPFTMFQLEAFNLAAMPASILFGVDNLTVNVVPEPATILLVSSGFFAIAAKLRSRKSRS